MKSKEVIQERINDLEEGIVALNKQIIRGLKEQWSSEKMLSLHQSQSDIQQYIDTLEWVLK